MDIKKVFLITLIVVAAIASISAAGAGFLDGLIGNEPQDNVIEIDNIKFNTTNVTKFELSENETDDYGYVSWFVDENDTGYNVHIFNYNSLDNDLFKTSFVPTYKERYDNAPTQTVNGVVIYTTTANTGNHIGEPRYKAYVENYDLNKIVDFSSPDPNETAKMALSLKFE
ncbi:MAG: hypothetical protein E7Z79_02400 [Methanobrevibacter thaueri]|uniref:Uncharacterized protein n=1 Tax=Methanobrevibacter thaueri TaxID=190975 RepID=A0A8T3V414_9EURY|nr:hypothetical protein [Methanobrevibacter thaueri]MBE6501273.1 hypothetical protein [Methanobrevibacter thaueri]